MCSCQNSKYKTVDFDAFQITVPSTWKKLKLEGIDSYVSGLITNTNDSLIFDLGWYSGDLTMNNEVLVFGQEEYSKFSIKKKEQLKHVKHLVVKDMLNTEYNPKDYLKYTFKWDSIDCFRAKFISPTNKGFGASGIYIDSLKGGGANSNKTRLSFYGNHLTDSIQKEFFKALKSISLKRYCE